jgi:hypothetical protein
MKRIFRKSKSKNTKNKYKYSSYRKNKNKNKKSSKKLKFTAHLKTMKKNVKYKHKRHIRHQKGGMLMSDMPDIWRFKNDDDFDSYRRYIFGSKRRAEAWASILIECAKRGIPVFVITSGNRTAMERMFQLTEIDKYIREVLSIRRDDVSNPNPRFPELTTKGQVIDAILQELKIECVPGETGETETVGAFIDDDYINFTGVPTCIKTINALDDRKHPKTQKLLGNISFEKENSQNPFYTSVFRANHMSLVLSQKNIINYIPESILIAAFVGISQIELPEGHPDRENKVFMDLVNAFKNTKVLFLDCDNTISVLPGVFNFHHEFINGGRISVTKKRVEKTPLTEQPIEPLIEEPLPTSLTTQEQ